MLTVLLRHDLIAVSRVPVHILPDVLKGCGSQQQAGSKDPQDIVEREH